MLSNPTIFRLWAWYPGWPHYNNLERWLVYLLLRRPQGSGQHLHPDVVIRRPSRQGAGPPPPPRDPASWARTSTSQTSRLTRVTRTSSANCLHRGLGQFKPLFQVLVQQKHQQVGIYIFSFYLGNGYIPLYFINSIPSGQRHLCAYKKNVFLEKKRVFQRKTQPTWVFWVFNFLWIFSGFYWIFWGIFYLKFCSLSILSI